MACDQAKRTGKHDLRRPPERGKRPQGTEKQQAVRKSARLQAMENICEQSPSKSHDIQAVHALLSPPGSNKPSGKKAPEGSQTLHNPSTSSRKRKREQDEREAEHPSPRIRAWTSSKRLRAEPLRCEEEESHPAAAASDTSENSHDPLQYWIQTGRLRKEYFEQDSQVRGAFERGKFSGKLNRLLEVYAMHGFPHLPHLFARKRPSPASSRSKSQSNTPTPSDQLPREVKSAQYNSPEYEICLEQKGSYMRKSALGITDVSQGLCRTLLGKEQTVPQNTLFRDDLFDETCNSVRGRNEAMVVRDISPLICPPAQILRIFGATNLSRLYESVNEGWNSMEAFEGTRPQPGYSVGFGRSAFSLEQLSRLRPFVGAPGSRLLTQFMATTSMYFPFLACEVKCGTAALEVADRQNAHSMTVAVRALVGLFRFVKREKELDREILALSISHDHTSVRIYGHYPVIEEDKTTFYRHPIRKFDFTDGEEKWTAYKFTKNVYDEWMPIHHERLCSAIDDLPSDVTSDLSQSASLAQSMSQSSQQSNAEPVLGEDDSQSSFLGSQGITPTTSFQQTTERASKKPKNFRATGQQC